MTASLRNNVSISGRGSQPLIFAHGFGCDQRMWRLVAPTFEADYKVVLFDYVGAGNSDLSAYRTPRCNSLSGYSLDLLGLMEELELEPAIVVAHSVSSSIALLASIERPQSFRALALVAPSPSFLNDPPDYQWGFRASDIEGLLELVEKNPMGWAASVAPIVMKNSDQPQLQAELNASFCAIRPDIARESARVTFLSNNRPDLPKVTVPSLILQCRDDALAPLEVGHYLHRQFRGSRLEILPVEGHCPHLSDPELTSQALRRYLSSL